MIITSRSRSKWMKSILCLSFLYFCLLGRYSSPPLLISLSPTHLLQFFLQGTISQTWKPFQRNLKTPFAFFNLLQKIKQKFFFFVKKKKKIALKKPKSYVRKQRDYIWLLHGICTPKLYMNSGEVGRERKRKALCRERKKRGERKNINDWGFKVVDYSLIHVDKIFIQCVNVWPLMIGLPAKHYDIVTLFLPNLSLILNKYFPYPLIFFT